MSKPELILLESLLHYPTEGMVIWTLPQLVPIISTRLSSPIVLYPGVPDPKVKILVVIGGGKLLDFSKVWRKKTNERAKLIAIPSIWGSGAENSPIAILNEKGKKVIYIGEEFLPDERVVWFELARNLPTALILYACGDVWAHTLEAFFSPLADHELRVELTCLINQLIELPFSSDEKWFEISARSCRAQAKSSVGAIHGVAHILEGVLLEKYPQELIGHARLCATLLWPLWRYNLSSSEKPNILLKQYNLDEKVIASKISGLFEKDFYQLILPLIEDNWRTILRDPSTRTNCTLVRQNTLDFLKQENFHE